jgi:putative nucleotidyltransferase-like protein
VTRPSTAVANALMRELAGWLEGPDPVRAGAIGRWSPATWVAFRQVVTMHGLAPHLAGRLPGSVVGEVMPPATLAWLAAQAGQNADRIRRMHDELGAILAAAAVAGVEVMPLKGAVLSTMPGADPVRRPMADLDLLVRPVDRASMGEILAGLGYRHVPERHRRPTHDVFVDPGGGRVVEPDGEHPGNPRKVELHVEVKRHLWGWVDDDELTDVLWRGATPGRIVGQPATLPRPESLLAHLAIHATSDLLAGRGRLIQWLDLGVVAPLLPELGGLPHPRLAYPSLRLAQRVLPGALGPTDLTGLEGQVPSGLVRWAATVRFDAGCGLTTGRPPDAPAGLGARWERWRPDRWRLLVAYGDAPLPVALVRHALTIAGRVRRLE